jgi:hypothetical protein
MNTADWRRNIFWGQTWPEIFGYVNNQLVCYHQFSNEDNIKIHPLFPEEIDSQMICNDGKIRKRRKFRLDLLIDVQGVPENRVLMEFFQRLFTCEDIEIKIHPRTMLKDGVNDIFKVIIDNGWEFDYLVEKWIGHGGQLKLKGNEWLYSIPISAPEMMGAHRIIESIHGILCWANYATICGAKVVSDIDGDLIASCNPPAEEAALEDFGG